MHGIARRNTTSNEVLSKEKYREKDLFNKILENVILCKILLKPKRRTRYFVYTRLVGEVIARCDDRFLRIRIYWVKLNFAWQGNTDDALKICPYAKDIKEEVNQRKNKRKKKKKIKKKTQK